MGGARLTARLAGGVARETVPDPARGDRSTPPWGMMQAMDDKTLIHQISALVDEEHTLRTELQSGKITEQEEHDRLRGIERQLDQLWDLLRRRRAARQQGVSPDQVEPHSIDEVENYLQ